jgi:hypothetical protein
MQDCKTKDCKKGCMYIRLFELKLGQKEKEITAGKHYLNKNGLTAYGLVKRQDEHTIDLLMKYSPAKHA